jgi:hypothetical protein
VIYHGYGNFKTWKNSTSALHVEDIKSTISKLNTNDVILFNVGLHWQSAKCSRPAGINININTTNNKIYRSSYGTEEYQDVVNFMTHIVLPANHSANCNSSTARNKCDKSDKSVTKEMEVSGPLVLWRETFPQHFPTSNGHYPDPDNPFVITLSATHNPCVPMTPAMYLGQGLPNNCNPNCLPATWQNDVALPIMRCNCIGIISVFRSLMCLERFHVNSKLGDCTHYEEKRVGAFVNHITLSMIQEKRRQRAEAGGAGAAGAAAVL